jgi:plastocyanin
VTPRRPARRATGAALAALAVAGCLSACSNQQDKRFTSTAQTVVTATVGADGDQRVDIDATDADRFVPDVVVVHPGRVTLAVHNTGGVPHTLEIPSLNVDTGNIAGHKVKVVSFSVDKPGSYHFDCAYHVTLHMEGTLKVVTG